MTSFVHLVLMACMFWVASIQAANQSHPREHAAAFLPSPSSRHFPQHSKPVISSKISSEKYNNAGDEEGDDNNDNNDGPDDTIRVRIWRALANGEEMSLKKLANAVGERRLGEMRSHLKHVEKQAKTLRNKSDDWRRRRGLPSAKDSKHNKMRLKMRKIKKEIYVRLD